MSSQIVNVNSVLNALASVIGLPLDIVRGWFPNESTQRSKALNVRSVANIFKQVLLIGFGVSVPNPIDTLVANGNITQDEGNKRNSSACSVNTCKELYATMMSGKTWNLKTSASELQYGHWYMPLTNTSITGSICGGEGGGSGSVYGADTFDVTSGNGADGGNTYILLKTNTGLTVKATATGSAGGAGVQVTGGKSAGALNGNAGGIASEVAYNVSVNVTDGAIGFFPGYGGGGSAGVRSPNTYVAPNAVGAKGANATNDGAAINNSMQGGGGGGGSGYLYNGTTIVQELTARGVDYIHGSGFMNYVSKPGGSIINGYIGGALARGGRGGDQADATPSLGGIYVSNSQRCGGGNGGNAGFATINTITSGFIFNDLGGIA